MVTPCDDKDPIPAVSSPPIHGEDDKSMIILALLRNNKTLVSSCGIYLILMFEIYSLMLLPYGTHPGMTNLV